MYEFLHNHGLFLLLSFFILYVVGVLASYAVCSQVLMEKGVSHNRRNLFYASMQWPSDLFILFIGGGGC